MAQLPKRHEQRWGERIGVNVPVQITTSSATGLEGRLKNVSLSGALMQAAPELRLHTLVEITIELPAPSQRSAVVEAYVSRMRDQEVGVEWCQFAPLIVKELLRSTSSRPSP
jgi:hypothetical protein